MNRTLMWGKGWNPGGQESECPPLTLLWFIKIHTEISGDKICNEDDSPLIPDQVELTAEQ